MTIAAEQTGAARQTWRAALAVLGLALVLLLAFHAAPRQAPWGAAGFDLALAAAGYALTRRMAAGPGGLLDAWGAAARWAAPAIALVVLTVLGAGLLILPPGDLAEEARLAVWTLAGQGGAALMGQGSYDPSVREELLLHGWILGVAAQLAVIWSALVVLAHRRRALLTLLATGGVLASLALDLWLAQTGREAYAFYLAPARAWPFLVGALAALWGGEVIDRVPAPRLLANLGAIALPTYLWAWPLIALPRSLLARPLTAAELTTALAAAVVLGLAAHRWVERPIRRRLAGRATVSLAAAGVASGGTALVAAAVWAAQGLPDRADEAVRAEAAAAAEAAPYQAACNAEGHELPPAAACTIPPGPPAAIVVWGDSHAAHLTPAVRAWAAGRGLSVRQATRSGCAARLRFEAGFQPPGCEAFNRAALAEWRRQPPRVILIGAGWTWALARTDDPNAPERLAADIRATVQDLRAAVGPETRIVLLGVTPDFAFAPARCHARRRFLRLDTARCDRAQAANVAAARDFDARLAAIAAAEAGVLLYRPWPAFCDEQACRTRGPDGPWYRDRTHLTAEGGRAQTAALGSVLEGVIGGR